MTDSYINKNLKSIEAELAPFGTKLLPVTKTFGIDLILEAYDAGYRSFGENRVQELLEKYEALPKDIEWHLIGHLQSNKVKYIAPFIGMIQSVDSEKLLAEIDKQAAKSGRIIPILLQVYIASEESKFGWDAGELLPWVNEKMYLKYPHVLVQGLMGMASNSEDENLVRSELKGLKTQFENLKKESIPGVFEMKVLSMGMSSDYIMACEEGSTLVRMGSAIFGKR